MLAIFENCSSTSEAKKAPVKPLELVLSCERAFQIILKDATDRELYGIKAKKDFYEIFYWYLGFEVTISLVQSTQGGKSYLNMMVYAEKKRGRTRKMLKSLIEYYRNLFKEVVR